MDFIHLSRVGRYTLGKVSSSKLLDGVVIQRVILDNIDVCEALYTENVSRKVVWLHIWGTEDYIDRVVSIDHFDSISSTDNVIFLNI